MKTKNLSKHRTISEPGPLTGLLLIRTLVITIKGTHPLILWKEEIGLERRKVMSEDDKRQDQKPTTPERPSPDEDLRDSGEIEDKRPSIALDESP